MKRTDDNIDTTHENISMLLPWYANKSLYGSELALVKQHLQVCSLCQQELTNLQQLSATIHQTNTFTAPTRLGNFDLLKERLQTNTTEGTNIIPLLPTANRRRWHKSASFKMPHTTSAKLSLAASVLLVILVPYIGQVPGVYKTVSSDKDPVKSINKENDNKISVIFKENTSQQNIEHILNAIQGHIINGPNAQSLYTIGFEEAVGRQQVIDKLLLLRSNTQVAFAEPAYSLLSATQLKKSE